MGFKSYYKSSNSDHESSDSESENSDSGEMDSSKCLELFYIDVKSRLKRLEEMKLNELIKFFDFLHQLVNLENMRIGDTTYDRKEVKEQLFAVRDILFLYKEDVFGLKNIPDLLELCQLQQDDVLFIEHNSVMHELHETVVNSNGCLNNLLLEEQERYLEYLSQKFEIHVAIVTKKRQCMLKERSHPDFINIPDWQWDSHERNKTVLETMIKSVRETLLKKIE
jgi:hypothetical protein